MGSFGCLEATIDARAGRMIDVRGGLRLSPPDKAGGYKMLDVINGLRLDIYQGIELNYFTIRSIYSFQFTIPFLIKHRFKTK